ncbi:MAG: biopolymer transporter ExbD [Nitrospirota bacterium]|nr:biopolymer transporter ExbD [Nitrospirota bacterium]
MKPRRHGHRRRSRLEPESDLNITAFLNLMVVLVPFLLTTAVFTRQAVLAIDVPAPLPPDAVTPAPPPPPPTDEVPFSLSLRLAADGVVVLAGKEPPVTVPRGADGAYDGAALRDVLAAIKQRHPEHAAADLLSRPASPYADLIAAMDVAAGTGADGQALFPDVRLGDYLPEPGE